MLYQVSTGHVTWNIVYPPHWNISIVNLNDFDKDNHDVARELSQDATVAPLS